MKTFLLCTFLCLALALASAGEAAEQADQQWYPDSGGHQTGSWKPPNPWRSSSLWRGDDTPKRKCPWWCPKNSHRDSWGCFCICDEGYVWNKSGQRCICDDYEKCMCEKGCPPGQDPQKGTCKCCPKGAVLDAACKNCICPYPKKWSPQGDCCTECSQGEVKLNSAGACVCECGKNFVAASFPMNGTSTNVCTCPAPATPCVPPRMLSPFTCDCELD